MTGEAAGWNHICQGSERPAADACPIAPKNDSPLTGARTVNRLIMDRNIVMPSRNLKLSRHFCCVLDIWAGRDMAPGTPGKSGWSGWSGHFC